MAARKRKSVMPERCPQHVNTDLDYLAARFDADDRLDRGERQERCAKCLRWLWPHQQGADFISTGESDKD